MVDHQRNVLAKPRESVRSARTFADPGHGMAASPSLHWETSSDALFAAAAAAVNQLHTGALENGNVGSHGAFLLLVVEDDSAGFWRV